MSEFLDLLPLVVAPFVLVIFSLVSAYIFKFGLPRTNILPDYMVFTIFIVLGLVLGGAI